MIEIVRANERHVDEIGDLWWEFMLHHQGIEPLFTFDETSVPGFKVHLRSHMESEDGLVLVALDANRAVGFSISEIRRNRPGLRREPHGFVDSLAVTAEYRRRGIGESMFAEITQWLRSKGIRRVELGTDSRNALATAFWEKQGFRIYHYTQYKVV